MQTEANALDALLLIARGTPDRKGRDAAETVAEQVRESRPGTPVALGYLTWQAPNVIAAAEQLIEQGARSIVAVPITAHEESLVTTTLARLLRRLARTHRHVSLRSAPSLERVPGLVQLIARAAEAAVDVPVGRVPQDDDVDDLRRRYAHPVRSERHVVMCASTYCAEHGATHMLDALRDRLDEYAERDPSKWVKLTRSGCLSVCGIAPALVVYPEGTWYTGFDAAQLEKIVDEHLIGGHPLPELACPVSDGPPPTPARRAAALRT